jgi:hypothetical protein
MVSDINKRREYIKSLPVWSTGGIVQHDIYIPVVYSLVSECLFHFVSEYTSFITESLYGLLYTYDIGEFVCAYNVVSQSVHILELATLM